MREIEERNCSNCGAPITTEICPYCGTATNVTSSQANMEFPVIECKEAHLNFWNTVFPLIFAIMFGSFGLIFPLAFTIKSAFDEEMKLSIWTFCSMFAIIGIIAFIIVLKNVIQYLTIASKGDEIEGTVYGYMNDNVFLNGAPAQIVKIRIETDEGSRFILYQTGDTKQPYAINSKIKLKKHKNLFRIEKTQL